jgi:hypothetical protein
MLITLIDGKLQGNDGTAVWMEVTQFEGKLRGNDGIAVGVELKVPLHVAAACFGWTEALLPASKRLPWLPLAAAAQAGVSVGRCWTWLIASTLACCECVKKGCCR